MDDFLSNKIFSVLEINTAVSELINAGFPGAVWVCGEIQGFRPDRNKRHIYFDLVQKDEKSNTVLAKVKAALFANRQPQITKRILSTNGQFDLKNDIEVKFLCEVSLHAPTGNYSLVIIDVDPVYTIGKMAQSRQKIIDELIKLGIIDKNKEVVIPDIPLNVGLITAYDSAAYHDFINELQQSGYHFKVSVINTHMQGKSVEKEVTNALRYFSSSKNGKYDVIVITRGGGAVSDLAWFDNSAIAKTIASLKMPVISALGHQIDLTVTDIVSNTTAKTPTKAAMLLVEKVKCQDEYINELNLRLKDSVDEVIASGKTALEFAARKLEAVIPKILNTSASRLFAQFHRLTSLSQRFMFSHREYLNSSFIAIAQFRKVFFKQEKKKLNNYHDKVNSFDPKGILKRGYTITRVNNKIAKRMSGIKPGDELRTCFFDGEIISKAEGK
ncbi:MAG: exodeoxyribonuclease VII large subunit [Candidatus Omnitrophica bacterium]|nr:exodeoxyribonuclease VII large subunit [Candidatus Omnitrophota bacterium]